MSKVLVFAGSTRRDSFHRKLALEAVRELESAGVAVTWADLRDYPMPLYDGDTESDQGLPPHARAFKEMLRAHDSFVVASPEYNGSFPALLKNTIDWVSRPEGEEKPLAVFRGKRAILLSTSPGSGGGRRGLQQLRTLLEGIGVEVVSEQLTVPKAFQAFDAEGKLVRPDDREQLKRLARLAAQERSSDQAA